VTPGILELQDLAVVYRGRSVLSVDRFAVLPGELLTIVGPNGAGKSTLLRVLALLEAPTTGVVRFDGEPVRYGPTSLLALRRRMATVFQAPLLCNTTVYGNIAMGLRFRRLAASEVDARVHRWAERFGATHLLKRLARSLSGGEAQRVSLARAFVLEPEVLFLDEPFSALDAPTRENLLSDLETVLRESRITAVFVTHDRTEALRLGSRIAVVMGGRVIQADSPEAVFAAPVNEDVARFVGVDNLLQGLVVERQGGVGLVSLGGETIQVLTDAQVGEQVLVCLRPEDIALAHPDSSPPSKHERNVLRGKIHRLVPLGAQLRVHVNAGAALTAVVTKRSWSDLGLADGEEVELAFVISAAHVIRGRKV
jgi:tungstate transport system ATP-binding protein